MPVTQFHEDTLDEYRTDLFHADNYALMKQVECDMEFQKVTRTRQYGHDIVCVNNGDLRATVAFCDICQSNTLQGGTDEICKTPEICRQYCVQHEEINDQDWKDHMNNTDISTIWKSHHSSIGWHMTLLSYAIQMHRLQHKCSFSASNLVK